MFSSLETGGRAGSQSQMPLLADGIGLRQPGPEVIVDLAELAQAKDVHMVAGRNALYPSKAGVLKAAGEHDMPVQPLLSRRHLREGHPDLKSDAGLLRQDSHRADGPQRRDDVVVERSNLRRLAPKMIGQMVAAAGVRLIPVRELTSTLLAPPECGLHSRLLIALILDPASPL